uniref:Uncharacterized protein n=1 Tax=Klebsiella pneumoniae TaxID=573 RepID=A0A6G9HSG1_KLEPN|nr:hypothetical protein [Klebsiella pneumoniae]
MPENPASYRVVRTKSYLFNKALYLIRAQTGENDPGNPMLKIKM